MDSLAARPLMTSGARPSNAMTFSNCSCAHYKGNSGGQRRARLLSCLLLLVRAPHSERRSAAAGRGRGNGQRTCDFFAACMPRRLCTGLGGALGAWLWLRSGVEAEEAAGVGVLVGSRESSALMVFSACW